MCKKTKGIHNRIDPCLKPLLKWLKSYDYEVVASCCGGFITEDDCGVCTDSEGFTDCCGVHYLTGETREDNEDA